MALLLLAAAVAALWLALGTGAVVGQTVDDDHGNSYDTATDVALGSSLEARIDPGHDRDVFRIDLSGESGDTDLWVYATADGFDTVGGLYDSAGTLIEFNDDSYFLGNFRSFSLRSVVPPGVYYVVVESYEGEPGDFTLHTQGVTAPGNTAETAAPLSLDSSAGGTIDAAGDADYFKLDFTGTRHVIIDAITADLAAIDAVLLDADGEEISENISFVAVRGFGLPFPIGFQIRESFEPGAYYLRVSLLAGPESDEPGLEEPAPDEGASSFRPVTYSVFYIEDTDYTGFLEECAAATSGLNDPEISDPLFSCQWHLSSSEWVNVNVEPAWAQGATGEGVNVAVVDDGMYHEHEDLKDNVATELNRDYTGNEDIYGRFEHHGTNVSGMIAARDNDIGVRGVAPRATIYGYNFLAPGASTLLNLLDAMTGNHEVTAVSNNSWGPFDGPELSDAPPFWEQAIDVGITAGNDGKGVFYSFAAGNGHLLGDDSNLDGVANYFGVTAVCSVHSGGSRAAYSEMGANLWVCAPSNDRPRRLGGVRGIVTTDNSDRYFQDFGGTSAAAPIVAGVAALMRDANPDLTWRDLKLILAATAQRNDPASSGWKDGAGKYRSTSDADRYHFNHEYGFGLVDAGAAVDLAQGWTNAAAADGVGVGVGVGERGDSGRPGRGRADDGQPDGYHRHEHRIHRVRRGHAWLPARLVPGPGGRAGVAGGSGFQAVRSVRHLHRHLLLLLRPLRAAVRHVPLRLGEAPGRRPERRVDAAGHGPHPGCRRHPRFDGDHGLRARARAGADRRSYDRSERGRRGPDRRLGGSWRARRLGHHGLRPAPYRDGRGRDGRVELDRRGERVERRGGRRAQAHDRRADGRHAVRRAGARGERLRGRPLVGHGCRSAEDEPLRLGRRGRRWRGPSRAGARLRGAARGAGRAGRYGDAELVGGYAHHGLGRRRRRWRPEARDVGGPPQRRSGRDGPRVAGQALHAQGS